MEKFLIFESSLSTPQIRIIGISPDDGDNTSKHLILEENERISILVNNVHPRSMHEHFNNIRQILAETELLFIAVNIFNETAVKIASEIAKIAKELDILTMALDADIKSISCEKNINIKFSDKNVEELKSEAGVRFFIPDINNCRCTNPNLLIKKEESQLIVTQFCRIINTIKEIVFNHGEHDIPMDIADIKFVMKDSKMIFCSIVEHRGKNAAIKAIINTIKLIQSEHISIQNASGVIVHFTMPPDFQFMELSSAIEVIWENVNEKADVTLTTTIIKELPLDFIRVTVVLAENKPMLVTNNIY